MTRRPSPLRLLSLLGGTLALLALGGVQLLGAGSDLDLTGRWKLDLDASTDIGPLLEAFGVDPATRAVARATVVTQAIRHEGDEVTIVFTSKWRDSKRTTPIDGTLAADEDPAGRKSQSRTTWGADRSTIVSRSEPTLADGTRAVFVVTRSRPSADTMLVHSRLVRPDRPDLIVKRVFRREG